MAYDTQVCSGCGKKIVWVVLDDGTRVPLDPVPAVYYIVGQFGPGGYLAKRVNGHKERAIGQSMVSHFTTCPKAAQFSKGGHHA